MILKKLLVEDKTEEVKEEETLDLEKPEEIEITTEEETKVEEEPTIEETPVEEVKTEEEVKEEEKTETLPEVPESVFSDIINAFIQSQWDLISETNNLLTSIDLQYDGDNKENITKLLNELVDDFTINVGISYKVAELISAKTSDLIDAGEEKAEDIINKD